MGMPTMMLRLDPPIPLETRGAATDSQWRSARTTNAIERLHEEFKRRIKTQTVLPVQVTSGRPAISCCCSEHQYRTARLFHTDIASANSSIRVPI
jgi:hypothetical protein